MRKETVIMLMVAGFPTLAMFNNCTTMKKEGTKVLDEVKVSKHKIETLPTEYEFTEVLEPDGSFSISIAEVQKGEKNWTESRQIASVMTPHCPQLYWSGTDCSFDWGRFALWHVVGVGFLADPVLPFLEKQKAENSEFIPTGKTEKVKKTEDVTVATEQYNVPFMSLNYEFIKLPDSNQPAMRRLASVEPSDDEKVLDKTGTVSSLSAAAGVYNWSLDHILNRAAASGHHVRITMQIGSSKFEKIFINDERIAIYKPQ